MVLLPVLGLCCASRLISDTSTRAGSDRSWTSTETPYDHVLRKVCNNSGNPIVAGSFVQLRSKVMSFMLSTQPEGQTAT